MKSNKYKKDINKNTDIQKKRKEIEQRYHNQAVKKIKLMIKQLNP